MAWDITRTEGGQVIISFGQLDAMVINKGASKNVTSASTLGGNPQRHQQRNAEHRPVRGNCAGRQNNHHPLSGRYGGRCRREHGNGQQRDHHASE